MDLGPGCSTFAEKMTKLLKDQTNECRLLEVDRHNIVYRLGEADDAIYLILQGQIKILVPTSKQQSGLVAIFAEGDFFGESCLDSRPVRQETAVAMKKASLLRIPREVFVGTLQRAALLEEMALHLSRMVEEQKQLIAALLAVKKHHRLALTLLFLARKFGKKEPNGTRINPRIVHEELAEMTGIRRSRVTLLLSKFRRLGLMEIDQTHRFIIREEEFTEFLEHGASGGNYRDPYRLDQPYIH